MDRGVLFNSNPKELSGGVVDAAIEYKVNVGSGGSGRVEGIVDHGNGGSKLVNGIS
jgi:hypothetical protein